MNASTNQPDKDEPLADLLVGARRIAEYITSLGVPVDESDVYYLHRSKKWPIGKHGRDLIASKRRSNRHAEKITRGTAA